jgi:hypothetical protein
MEARADGKVRGGRLFSEIGLLPGDSQWQINAITPKILSSELGFSKIIYNFTQKSNQDDS